jgi:cytochrome bd-type quinol oxidase subunit 2
MDDAELFLRYNYPETKDMCLHFLTLVTAVLVFSLNFAEKVFDFQNSTTRKRLVVIGGWCLFILSIIFGGLGLATNSLAGGDAVYEQKNYQSLAQLSYRFIILAGGSFITGLVLIMVSAVISRTTKAKDKEDKLVDNISTPGAETPKP